MPGTPLKQKLLRAVSRLLKRVKKRVGVCGIVPVIPVQPLYTCFGVDVAVFCGSVEKGGETVMGVGTWEVRSATTWSPSTG